MGVNTPSKMPQSPSPLPSFDDLTDDDIDALIAHPHWEPLGETIDALIAKLPLTTERAERTTLLTWLYSQQGVASFEELAAKLAGFPSMPKRKKHLRGTLRALERLRLVSIVTFAEVEGESQVDDDAHETGSMESKDIGAGSRDAEDAAAPDPSGVGDDGVVGRLSMVSLTWTGVVWLRRAWGARERLARHRNILEVHQSLIEEEDGGKSNDAYWVENLVSTDSVPGAAAKRAQRIADVPAISSIFALAHAAKLEATAGRRVKPSTKASTKAISSR